MALGLTVGDTVTVCIGVGAVVRVWGEELERTGEGGRERERERERERKRERERERVR